MDTDEFKEHEIKEREFKERVITELNVYMNGWMWKKSGIVYTGEILSKDVAFDYFLWRVFLPSEEYSKALKIKNELCNQRSKIEIKSF